MKQIVYNRNKQIVTYNNILELEIGKVNRPKPILSRLRPRFWPIALRRSVFAAPQLRWPAILDM